MKNFSYILFLVAALSMSCEDYLPEEPVVCVTCEYVDGTSNGLPNYVEGTTVSVGEAIYFSSCGDANKLVVYTGDEGHVYGQEDNYGAYFSSEDGARYEYTYEQPGEYTVTLVGTNASFGTPEVTTKQGTSTVVVTVVE